MDNFNLKKYLAEGKLHEDDLTSEKQEIFKDITQIMDQELTSGKPTYDVLVKLRDFINNMLESDF